MRYYLQADKSTVIDTQSYEFIPMFIKERPFEMEIPFYLWSAPEPHARVIGESVMTKTQRLTLHNLQIDLSLSYRKASLEFLDSMKGRWETVLLSSFPTASHQGTPNEHATGVDHSIAAGGVVRKYRVDFNWSASKFKPIADFDSQGIAQYKTANFSFGISPEQFKVVYCGKELSGESYAFVCGPWAVLLTDDLSFDALALLDGAETGRLHVARFAYAANPYIVRAMTLLGGS